MINYIRIDESLVAFSHKPEPFSSPFPLDNFKKISQPLADLLRIPPATLNTTDQEQVFAFLANIGKNLFDHLFKLHNAYPFDQRGPIFIDACPELEHYPWELLNDGQHWLALAPGIVRLTRVEKPASSRFVRESHVPMSTLSSKPIFSNPLQYKDLGYQQLGEHFINRPRSGSAYTIQDLNHAQQADLGDLLSPSVLYFSGFSTPESLVLEDSQGQPQRIGYTDLGAVLHDLVDQGLQCLILNDSQSVINYSNALLKLSRSGLPAVVQICSYNDGPAIHDYCRIFSRSLAEGKGVLSSHLASITYLAHRHPHNWEWFFFRLAQSNQLQSAPLHLAADNKRSLLNAPANLMPDATVLNCHQAEADIIRWIDSSKSPPVMFVSGHSGSGKSVLALDIASRMRRRFTNVMYIDKNSFACDDWPEDGSLSADLDGVKNLNQHLYWNIALRIWAGVKDIKNLTQLDEQIADWLAKNKILLILDGFSSGAANDFCAHLLKNEVQTNSKLLWLVRNGEAAQGRNIHLRPLNNDDFEYVLKHQLQKMPLLRQQSKTLHSLLCGDVQLCRILSNLPIDTVHKLFATHALSSAQSGDLFKAAVEQLLSMLDGHASKVLKMAGLFTAFLARENLSSALNIGRPEFDNALRTLEGYGLLNSYRGGSFYQVPARVSDILFENNINELDIKQALPALLRVYLSYIAENTAALTNPPLYAVLMTGDGSSLTDEQRKAANHFHDFCSEQVNISELIILLAEQELWADILHIQRALRFVIELPGLDSLRYTIARYALIAANKLGQTKALTNANITLSRLWHNLGARNYSYNLLKDNLELLSDDSDWESLCLSYLELGCLQTDLQPEAALNMLYSARKLAIEFGLDHQEVDASIAIAQTALKQTEIVDKAHALLSESLDNVRGKSLLEAKLTLAQAELIAHAGRYNEALKLSNLALNRLISKHHREHKLIYTAQLNIARMSLAVQQPQTALQCLEQAINSCGCQRLLDQEEDLLEKITTSFESLGEYAVAIQSLEMLKKNVLINASLEKLQDVYDRMGVAYFQLGEKERSTNYYRLSLELKEQLANTTA